MTRSLAGMLFAFLALASTGCAKRTILAFDDHPQNNLTTLQALRVKSYVFWSDSEHQYFLCTDTGDKLVCKRSCGAGTDLECPKTVDTGYNSSNVR